MEKRAAKVNISAAGGTAGKNSKTYKVSLPSAWMAALGVSANDRDVELSLDGDRIILSRPRNSSRFRAEAGAEGHDVKTYIFHDGDKVCTRIIADFTDKTVCADNYIDDPIKTAFGKNTMPTWEDFMSFLEERCIPQERAGIREYLETIGLDEYDPVQIVKKTRGRMAEDAQWLEVIE